MIRLYESNDDRYMVNYYWTVRRRDSELDSKEREEVIASERKRERARDTVFDGTFTHRDRRRRRRISLEPINLKKRTTIRTADGGACLSLAFLVTAKRRGHDVRFVSFATRRKQPFSARRSKRPADTARARALNVAGDHRERERTRRRFRTTRGRRRTAFRTKNPSTGKLKRGRDNNGSPFSYSGPNTVDNSPVRLCRYLKPLRNGA